MKEMTQEELFEVRKIVFWTSEYDLKSYINKLLEDRYKKGFSKGYDEWFNAKSDIISDK